MAGNGNEEMFKTTLMGGFDKDDVLRQVQKMKDEAYAETVSYTHLPFFTSVRISLLSPPLYRTLVSSVIVPAVTPFQEVLATTRYGSSRISISISEFSLIQAAEI